MITRDYIMRMINLLAAALARVLSLKKEKDFPQALLEIERTYKHLLGVHREFLHRLSDIQMIDLLGSDQTAASSKYYVLGMLLKEEGEILQLQEKSAEGFALSETSLSLLIESFLYANGPADENHAVAIDTLIERLRLQEVSPRVKEKMFTYFEHTGRYSKAEDTLFELIQTDPTFMQRGVQFYRRLLSKTDDQLLRGNLPRVEIEQALEDLQERANRSTGRSA